MINIENFINTTESTLNDEPSEKESLINYITDLILQKLVDKSICENKKIRNILYKFTEDAVINKPLSELNIDKIIIDKIINDNFNIKEEGELELDSASGFKADGSDKPSLDNFLVKITYKVQSAKKPPKKLELTNRNNKNYKFNTDELLQNIKDNNLHEIQRIIEGYKTVFHIDEQILLGYHKSDVEKYKFYNIIIKCINYRIKDNAENVDNDEIFNYLLKNITFDEIPETLKQYDSLCEEYSNLCSEFIDLTINNCPILLERLIINFKFNINLTLINDNIPILLKTSILHAKKYPQLFNLLVNEGIEIKQNDKYNILHYAVEKHILPIIQILVEHYKFDINQKIENESLLHFALREIYAPKLESFHNQALVIKYLINKGINFPEDSNLEELISHSPELEKIFISQMLLKQPDMKKPDFIKNDIFWTACSRQIRSMKTTTIYNDITLLNLLQDLNLRNYDELYNNLKNFNQYNGTVDSKDIHALESKEHYLTLAKYESLYKDYKSTLNNTCKEFSFFSNDINKLFYIFCITKEFATLYLDTNRTVSLFDVYTAIELNNYTKLSEYINETTTETLNFICDNKISYIEKYIKSLYNNSPIEYSEKINPLLKLKITYIELQKKYNEYAKVKDKNLFDFYTIDDPKEMANYFNNLQTSTQLKELNYPYLSNKEYFDKRKDLINEALQKNNLNEDKITSYRDSIIENTVYFSKINSILNKMAEHCHSTYKIKARYDNIICKQATKKAYEIYENRQSENIKNLSSKLEDMNKKSENKLKLYLNLRNEFPSLYSILYENSLKKTQVPNYLKGATIAKPFNNLHL